MAIPACLGRASYHLCVVTCSLLAVSILEGCGGNSGPTAVKPTLPSPMIAGYTSGASVEKISNAVNQGLNVIFWSFMELEANQLKGGLSSQVVGPTFEALVKMNRTAVLHFVSFGGWNVAHTLAGTCGATQCAGQVYAESFRAWNEQMKSNISGFPGFAGIDWDIEGVNDVKSPSNNFTLSTLEIMLDMSSALRDEFLISMVPPQSYFNCQDSGFDLSLENRAESTPSFTYAGRNVYALLYAKCPQCFDLVMVQLYESYSPAGFDLYWAGNASNVGRPGWPRNATNADMTKVIHNNIQCLATGWQVNFDGFWGVPTQTVVVPANKIVIGLANGWALPVSDTFKVPFFAGKPCGDAWCKGANVGWGDEVVHALGFMYWDISDDKPSVSLVEDLYSTMMACGKQTADSEGIVV